MMRRASTSSASAPSFMLLGGVSTLPSASLVRGLQAKPRPGDRMHPESQWDYQYFRAYGVAPPRETKSKAGNFAAKST